MEILYLTLKWNTNLCKYLLIFLRERKAKIHRICKNQISKWKITRKMYKFKYPVQYQMEISCYQLSIHPWISGVIKANISSQKSSPINEWKLRKLCIKKIQFLVDTKHYSFIEMYLHLYIYYIIYAPRGWIKLEKSCIMRTNATSVFASNLLCTRDGQTLNLNI